MLILTKYRNLLYTYNNRKVVKTVKMIPKADKEGKMKKTIAVIFLYVFFVFNIFAQSTPISQLIYTETASDIIISDYEGRFTSVIIPEMINGKPVTAIGEGAFLFRQLTRISIPNSVAAIGDFAFADNHLTSVIIPNGVTFIGRRAFSWNQLTSVIIPNGVISIGEGAFSWNRLTSVIIPDSVTSIGSRAFLSNVIFRNTMLTSVTIGADVALGLNAIGDGFDDFYNNSGRAAGRYTRPNTNSTTWTKQ